MVYKVTLTNTARSTFGDILENEEYTPRERLKYLEELEARCFALQDMPQRFAELGVNTQTYRVFTYKAHRVFYQINDETMTVYIVSIIGERQLPDKHVS